MGIEAPMIVNSEGTPFKDFVELPNGCICCSAKYNIFYLEMTYWQLSNI